MLMANTSYNTEQRSGDQWTNKVEGNKVAYLEVRDGILKEDGMLASTEMNG